MKIGLSEAYKLFKDISKKNAKALSLEDLEQRILEADQDLLEDFEKFRKRVLQAEECLKKRDQKGLFENLMYMRIHAVGASAEFDNLVAVLDEAASSIQGGG